MKRNWCGSCVITNAGSAGYEHVYVPIMRKSSVGST